MLGNMNICMYGCISGSGRRLRSPAGTWVCTDPVLCVVVDVRAAYDESDSLI